MKKIILLISILIFFGYNLKIFAQENLDISFKVLNENSFNSEILVSIPIDESFFKLPKGSLSLFIVDSQDLINVPFQFDEENRRIWFKHIYSEKKSTQYKFITSKNFNQKKFSIKKENGDLKINYKNQNLITYRYKIKLPPKGVDRIYQKSGYIHPVLSLNGDTLTRIQPPDHYHHYGIWGPWTRTKIDGIKVDFWNLKDGEGTVLFDEFNHVNSGSIYAGFSANQIHLNLTKGKRQTSINETLIVKVWKNEIPKHYFIDYSTKFSTPLIKGILFEAYRYGGGLGFRFKKQWHKDNCIVLTSEGNDRVSADGTSAKWCIVFGESNDKKGTNGVLFMSHPRNKSHPEPMRIWPTSANNNRGDMFFEFCPIRNNEWKINYNELYQLNYRMLVFEGEMTSDEAEAHWTAFAFPPKITFN